jgi:hypothetical protein
VKRKIASYVEAEIVSVFRKAERTCQDGAVKNQKKNPQHQSEESENIYSVLAFINILLKQQQASGGAEKKFLSRSAKFSHATENLIEEKAFRLAVSLEVMQLS